MQQACWQIAADLLSSSRSKPERVLISAWWQQDNKPAADLMQLAHFWPCSFSSLFSVQETGTRRYLLRSSSVCNSNAIGNGSSVAWRTSLTRVAWTFIDASWKNWTWIIIALKRKQKKIITKRRRVSLFATEVLNCLPLRLNLKFSYNFRLLDTFIAYWLFFLLQEETWTKLTLFILETSISSKLFFLEVK